MKAWHFILFGFLLICQPFAGLANNQIIIQSTTSTANSGLLDAILPAFENMTGIKVRVVAVGTGQALKNAANGDADVLLVHSKEQEEEFVAAGWGLQRQDVMYNDLILVGPESDPADIAQLKNVTEAFSRIWENEAIFISRADNSGTHMAELRLWAEIKVEQSKFSGSWYREIGSGMGATLNMAGAMDAYTLSDRATWLTFGNKQNLKVLVEGDPRLFNQYGVIAINPARHQTVNQEGARLFIDWLTGEKGQSQIARFKVNGQQLFFPNAQE